MSESFAHQYLQRKKKCPKAIVEQGLTPDVTKMLEIANPQRYDNTP